MVKTHYGSYRILIEGLLGYILGVLTRVHITTSWGKKVHRASRASGLEEPSQKVQPSVRSRGIMQPVKQAIRRKTCFACTGNNHEAKWSEIESYRTGFSSCE